MSSIYGIVSKTQTPPDAERLALMKAVLPHSYQFSDTEYECQDNSIGLGMRHPRRPLLTNEARTITLACIGAIPNFRDLREEMLSLGHSFDTSYDAETLVHLYEEKGRDLLSSIKGPFCLALWDSEAQRLILATDPMGQKPLYYYEDAEQLIFASAIPPLLAHQSVPRQSTLDDSFVRGLALHTGRLPDTTTAFEDIRVLSAGEQLVWERGATTKRRYWSMPSLTPAEPEATIIDHEDHIRERLAESARLYLTEDSVGVLLSGGISSSLVAAMMQQQNRPLQAFTIRFQDKNTPEILRAAEVARHLGAKHTILTVKQPDLSQLLSRLVWDTANPFLSPHDVLMGLLSEAVNSHISVALVGTGGVSLLGDPMPPIKSRPRIRRMWQAANTLLQRARAARRREEANADTLSLFSPSEVKALIGIMPDVTLPPTTPPGRAEALITARLSRHLAPTYHISRGSGIDVQVPFADAQVIEAAALVPLNLRQRPGQPLYVLQEAARGLLPSAFLKTPVAPEHLPLDVWMREQQAFIREILLDESTLARNIANEQAVYKLIEAHMSQGQDASASLLALLSLEIWHRLFIDSSPMTPPA